MWKIVKGDALTPRDIYSILKIRNEVFIVEQECHYFDLDELDLLPTTTHIFQYQQNNIDLNAYARIMYHTPPHIKIGRVAVAKSSRSSGLGKQLMTKAIEYIESTSSRQFTEIRIHAQYYLLNWYTKFGFEPYGEPFDDAGVKHIGMYIKLTTN